VSPSSTKPESPEGLDVVMCITKSAVPVDDPVAVGRLQPALRLDPIEALRRPMAALDAGADVFRP
jgi:hypothetical protein